MQCEGCSQAAYEEFLFPIEDSPLAAAVEPTFVLLLADDPVAV